MKYISDEDFINSKNTFSHIKWRHSYFKNENADIVISFLDQLNIINILSMTGLKIPLIVCNRCDPRYSPANSLYRLIRNFLFNFAEHIIVQSKKSMCYFNKIIQKKTTIIYNEVCIDEYVGKALYAEKENKIVWVGRLDEQKNPHMMIDGFNKIKDEFPEYKLHFIGDGYMKNELIEYVKIKNLSDKVFFDGISQNICEDIVSAKLFVMTSNYEGMSNSMLEAMCIGLPVISTKVSGADELIINKENGYLIECGDTEGLVNTMREILLNNEIQKKTANNAVNVYDKLNEKIIIKQWKNCIGKLINK